ncbi:hypothetical protein FQA39_LY07916 [Lamprigera yunnana]|nr:hypothetical protein FQA39_LY07916 [Lamprigera yunnana]
MKLPSLFKNKIGNGLPTFQYLAAFTDFVMYLFSSRIVERDVQRNALRMVVAVITEAFAKRFSGSNDKRSKFVDCDRLGRKTVILFTPIPYLASWYLIAFGRSAYTLMAGRFVAGIGDGLIYCAFPMYLGEIADTRIRGFLGSSISVMSISGILFMNILGSYLSITAAAMVASAVPVLLLLTFSFMPESPYYLIMKKKNEQAKRNLMILKGTQNVNDEVVRLIKVVSEENERGRRWFDLVSVKSNRRALFIVMGARAAQQLTGTIAITFYVQTILREAGDAISPSAASILYFTIHTILVGFSSVIVDKVSRRPLMIISIIGACIALLVEGCYFYVQHMTDIDTTHFSSVPVVTLIIFILSFSIGMQPIPILLIGEIFPTNVKAIALTVCSNYFVIVTTVLPGGTSSSWDSFGSP